MANSYASDHLATANKAYVANFGNKGSLPLPPGKHVAIVGCMDARLDTMSATGLCEGDAHHIRNAGGRASDAIRSLVISQALLGTKEIIVIHHTGCGMLTFKGDQARDVVKSRPEIKASQHPAVDAIAFLEFADLDQSIHEDVEFLKAHPLILAETKISGWKYLASRSDSVFEVVESGEVSGMALWVNLLTVPYWIIQVETGELVKVV